MNSREFVERASAVLGDRWMALFARAVGRDYASVKRWAAGIVAVPQYAVAIIELLERLAGEDLPQRWERVRRVRRREPPAPPAERSVQ